MTPGRPGSSSASGARAAATAGGVGEGGSLPGEVIDAEEGLVVACGHGAYRILSLQREGRKPLEADAFLRGSPLPQGTRMGP